MELRREEQRGVQTLFNLGYANRNEVRRIELTYLQAEGQFAAKINQLQTEVATLKKMQVYEQRKDLLALEGKVATAKRGLEQVLRNNEAKLAQMQALMRAKEESWKKEEERLARYESQLKKCKIYAPHAGLVAYPNNKQLEVREGVPVIYRQKLYPFPTSIKCKLRLAFTNLLGSSPSWITGTHHCRCIKQYEVEVSWYCQVGGRLARTKQLVG